jgi:hypothetical protein
MKKGDLFVDFARFAEAFRQFVRSKAIAANSTIIYVSEGQLIEEEPKTSQKTVLKPKPGTING